MQSLFAISAVLAGLLTLAAAQNSPTFGQAVYSSSHPESEPIGHTIATVTATDTDTLTYSMTADSKFTIDPSTGVVTIISPLDYETTTKVSLTVTATDTQNNEANALLIITITDINDNAPVFMQEYTASISSTNGVISSMTPLTIAAIDLDSGVNAEIRYSLVAGGVSGNFAIDATTGELTLVSPVTASGSISVTVQAQDQGTPQLDTTSVVTLDITETASEPTYTCAGVNWMVNRGDGKCYKLVRGRKTWDDAQRYCRWLGNKSGLTPGNLVTIEDSAKQDWVLNTLMNQRISLWTGLNDQASEGNMTWVDGSSYNSGDFSNWAVLNGVQQPAGGTTKNCVAIEGTIRQLGAFYGKWNDFKCAMKTWSVCEFPANVV